MSRLNRKLDNRFATPSNRLRLSRRARCERGGALIELAIALPVFMALLAIIFDAGLGFGAARESTSAAQSGARIAAQSANDRLADFRAIDLIRSEYSDSTDRLVAVTVYRALPGGSGDVPSGCEAGSGGTSGLCNVYNTVALSLSQSDFETLGCVGDPDANWCPQTRVPGEYVGVAVWVDHDPTIGLASSSAIRLASNAVYPLFIQDAVPVMTVTAGTPFPTTVNPTE